MKTYSLKNQKEFAIVNRCGRKIFTPYGIIILASNVHLQNNTDDLFAFGMKVSKKISKKAVIRNKIKRRIRHLIRLIANAQDVNLRSKAVIIIPKKNFDNVDFAELQKTFEKTIK